MSDKIIRVQNIKDRTDPLPKYDKTTNELIKAVEKYGGNVLIMESFKVK